MKHPFLSTVSIGIDRFDPNYGPYSRNVLVAYRLIKSSGALLDALAAADPRALHPQCEIAVGFDPQGSLEVRRFPQKPVDSPSSPVLVTAEEFAATAHLHIQALLRQAEKCTYHFWPEFQETPAPPQRPVAGQLGIQFTPSNVRLDGSAGTGCTSSREFPAAIEAISRRMVAVARAGGRQRPNAVVPFVVNGEIYTTVIPPSSLAAPRTSPEEVSFTGISGGVVDSSRRFCIRVAQEELQLTFEEDDQSDSWENFRKVAIEAQLHGTPVTGRYFPAISKPRKGRLIEIRHASVE